jgi:hypothetical protein
MNDRGGREADDTKRPENEPVIAGLVLRAMALPQF